MIAYLVVREGNKWRDVYRLTPGQVMTIGRAPTNRVVLHHEVCSRFHCEVFENGSQWTVRDLGSRNGTLLDGQLVKGDIELEPGSVISIGPIELGFTHDLNQAFPRDSGEIDNDTGLTPPREQSTPEEPTHPTIVSRKKKTRYGNEAPNRERDAYDLAELYRLAVEMGNAQKTKKLAEVVLNGIMSRVKVEIGAVLLLPAPVQGDAEPSALQVVAYRPAESTYQIVSDHISRIAFKDREIIVAQDVFSDSQLQDRDSLGELAARSVLCAPVCNGPLIYGLIHLYGSGVNAFQDEDSDFVLAVANQFAIVLDNVRQKEVLADGLAKVRDENNTLREQLGIESQLVGDSPYMVGLRAKIGRIAPTDAIVLIRGESGVGKELVARAIHYNSRRRNGPFVCMNCAALSESLLESELFGHEKGSFTGATGRKIGKFEQAHKGTLMLDEVGEMSLAIQSKFLRVLEGHPFERVGGGAAVQVDVRVVAATNRDLEKAVERGTFRKDLYFRLMVVEALVEPLRNHSADVPQLAQYFLEKFARKSGRPVKGFSHAAMEKLTSYDWPGNIRELQNTIERSVILSTGNLVDPTDIQLCALGHAGMDTSFRGTGSGLNRAAADGSPAAPFTPCTLDTLEQQHILAVLEHTRWNKSQAATLLGIERSTLDRKLKRYQVGRPDE